MMQGWLAKNTVSKDEKEKLAAAELETSKKRAAEQRDRGPSDKHPLSEPFSRRYTFPMWGVAVILQEIACPLFHESGHYPAHSDPENNAVDACYGQQYSY